MLNIILLSSDDKEKSSEDNSHGPVSGSAPTKRPREESRAAKIDPTKAPDPEEAEKFDEEEFQSEACSGFTLPEDKGVVTLDPCEWVWSSWRGGSTVEFPNEGAD